MYPPAVAEPDFRLGRVHVHVHVPRRHLQQQRRGRVPARLRQPAVRLAQGVLDEPVADRPAVEVEVLVFRGRAGQLGQADQAPEAHLRVADAQRQALLVELVRPRREQPLFLARGRQVQRGPAVVQELEGDLRPGQGEAQQGLGDVPELGGRALDELAPCGCVEKEVADLDGGANVAGRRLHPAQLAAAVGGFVSGVAVRGAGEDAGVGYRPDAGQCLAAKAHGGNAEQVVIARDLAGGMGSEGEG